MRSISQNITLILERGLVKFSSGQSSRHGNGRKFAAAIVKLDRLGDFILALTTIRRITEFFGESECLLIVSPFAAAMAKREFPTATHIVIPASLHQFRAALAALRFRRLVSSFRIGLAVCLRHQRWDYDEFVLSWLSCRECVRIGNAMNAVSRPTRRNYECRLGGIFEVQGLNSKTCDGDFQLSRELESNRQILERVLSRPVTGAEVLPQLNFNGENQKIVVSPFGSSDIRDIPLPLLRRAIDRVSSQIKDPIVLIGTSQQRTRLMRLSRVIGRENIEIACGLTLDEYLYKIGGARVVITTETATAHIATAYNCRTLIIIGGGHFGQYGPWRRSLRQQWISHRMDCEGCDWKCIYPAPECITRVSDEQIDRAIERLLSVD